ncbi:chromate resistance protein ChrB domain-containing protein [uncultured Castellaniella sp.]|uniref:chromate resistance protein ChrB domain-containing protein n=1 Tax=uncultured Castellaniella sp. TaxID=647907 RepID=UPI00262D0E26|nr:chromate resistance protein ChrB domain-containing protein [uncultured Castellaniella sp.]
MLFTTFKQITAGEWLELYKLKICRVLYIINSKLYIMTWLLLVTSLPTQNATVRMRAWRALKSCGAAVLRDGVYVLPETASGRSILETIGADVREGGGMAHVLCSVGSEDAQFVTLFDRAQDYAALLGQVEVAHRALSAEAPLDVLKRIRKLRKAFASLIEIDFFPGEAQHQVDAALQELELTANQALTPDEPHAIKGTIPLLFVKDYQGRTWATRRRPWVDRLACAWLIRRFIDPQGVFLWLESPTHCPADALGFDFDGATFTHIDARVSFEVLLASFGLNQSALKRIGVLVHYLDVGGVQPSEASGVECVLAGLRDSIADDDQLVIAASGLFDGLLTTFNNEIQKP